MLLDVCLRGLYFVVLCYLRLVYFGWVCLGILVWCILVLLIDGCLFALLLVLVLVFCVYCGISFCLLCFRLVVFIVWFAYMDSLTGVRWWVCLFGWFLLDLVTVFLFRWSFGLLFRFVLFNRLFIVLRCCWLVVLVCVCLIALVLVCCGFVAFCCVGWDLVGCLSLVVVGRLVWLFLCMLGRWVCCGLCVWILFAVAVNSVVRSYFYNLDLVWLVVMVVFGRC